MSVKISSIDAIQVLDSRGNPTVSAVVSLSDGSTGFASVPSGASTGQFEAIELRDGDNSYYRGKGVNKAVSSIRDSIRSALTGFDPFDQKALDYKMLELDGTENKSKIGANAILGVSLATAHAASKSRGVSLFKHLAGLYGTQTPNQLPVPLVNVINGGAHANNSLDIQEFMLVPHGFNSFSDAIRAATEVFHSLGKLLKDDGYNTAVGDEGGYAPQLEKMDLAFEYILKAIEKSGYKAGSQISLALDVASSELVEMDGDNVFYKFTKSGLGKFSSVELVQIYANWCAKYPIVSIEDGLGENDWKGWKECTTQLGSKIQLVGDDLFVTNKKRIARGIDENIANSVLIKLNQIGSLTETFEAMQSAVSAKYTNVISHRSGETADTTISDLAVATNAGQIKTGSMCRGERTEKYNRLLWIEHELGQNAVYKDVFKK